MEKSMQSRYGINFPSDLPKDLPPTEKELEVKYGKEMENDLYALPMWNYVSCVNSYFNENPIPRYLEKQLDRVDLDTVCGIELHELKRLLVH